MKLMYSSLLREGLWTVGGPERWTHVALQRERMRAKSRVLWAVTKSEAVLRRCVRSDEDIFAR